MIDDTKKQIVHRDSASRYYHIETDGKDSRLVKEDTPYPIVVIASAVRNALRLFLR